MRKGTFGTALKCMDGRIHEQVETWMRSHFSVMWIDAITEPGMDRFLAEESEEELAGIKKKLSISINKHGSRFITVVGHAADCAGNPVPIHVHREHIKCGVERVRSWRLGGDITIVGLLLNEKWEVELL